MGGLSKKAFQFNQAAIESGKPFITLDAGALLFKDDTLNSKNEDTLKVTAEGIVKSYNAMGYKAVGIGREDLIAGIDYLKKIESMSDFDWLSANLLDRESNKSIFPTSKIYEIGSLSIGVIGLTGDVARLQSALGETVVQAPWKEVLPDLATQLSTKTDLLVLLSNLTDQENRLIAQNYPINLIISSGGSTINIEPIRIGNALICQTAKQGKYVGIMDIDWQPSSLWGDKKPEILAQKKQSLDRLLWRLSKYQKTDDPVAALQNEPARLRTYQNLVEQEKNLRQEITQLSASIEAENVSKATPSTYNNRFIAMKTDLPDLPEVKAIVEEINEAVNAIGRKKAETLLQINKNYAGWRPCKNCHEDIFNKWQQTGHADAFTSLVEKKQQFNTNCLACHVTGVPLDMAEMALSLPAELKLVGCEACHGPGKKHSEAPGAFKLTAKPEEAVCLACHNTENDDSFDYNLDSKLVH